MKNKNPLNSFTTFYKKISIFGKLLFLLAIILILVIFFKSIKNPKKITEGFMQNENFLFKSGKDVYDDFYSEIYDFLVFNNLKSNYETGAIISETSPSTHSRILDVGCGTGHHVAKLTASDLDVIGLDISPSMINQAKTTYPKCNFEVGDVMNGSAVPQNSFTHILCMYFTIYYFKDKDRFFENSFNWLQTIRIVEFDFLNVL